MYGKRKRSQKCRPAKRYRASSGRSPYFIPGGNRGASGSRRTRSTRTSTSLWRSLPNVPDTLGIQVRTYVQLTFTSPVGATTNGQWPINDITDPFGTSSVHTNPTLNNFATMYQRATVMSAKLDFKWHPDSGNGNVCAVWGVYFTNQDTGRPTITNSNENIVPEATRSLFYPLPTLGGFNGKANFRKYVSCSSVAGLSAGDYSADPNFWNLGSGTAWSTSPTNRVFASVTMRANDKTNACVYYCLVTMTQYVLLSNRVFA